MEESTDRKRLQDVIDTVMKVARGDYSVQNELSGKNDDLDALAMGLNMMIDDLRNNVDLELKNKRIEAINAELKKAKEKAQESDRLKSAFLANMSHEIRTPMNAIMGFSDILKSDCSDPEKSRRYLSYIENAGKQLLALINDILDISKIESGQMTIHSEVYNLKDLLDQVFEIAKQDKKLDSKPDLKLILNCDESTDHCFINTDQVRFKQIFINLIDNAVKFTEEGSVEVGWSLKKKRNRNIVELYVKDTGTGIPSDLQDVIFERFRQVHVDRIQEGTGLGLSITKGLVNKLGGELSVESVPGRGTVFHIGFPCIIKQKQQEKKTGKAESPVNLSDSLIYIAEDEDTSYILLEEMLKPYGSELKRAENGRKLLDLIEKQIPDFVLLDIKLPVMDGYAAVKEIRRRNYTFPVVAQTSYAMADEQTAILDSGCDGYISKPIDPDELIKELKKHLSVDA